MASLFPPQSAQIDTPQALLHELRYQSLFREGRGFSFPCDERGDVNLDALSERARNNYLFARAMVGRELARPEVRVLG
jgi:hypothetical protein